MPETPPPPSGSNPLERITQAGSVETVFPAVYSELRRVAESYMRQARPGHTLQATALINEAYLKLAGLAEAKTWTRPHLLAVASLAMRQILVNHARDRARLRRDGGGVRVTLSDEAAAEAMPDADLIALHEAMERLGEVDARKARVVEMRFFGGMSVEEIAAALDVGAATVKRDWAMARAWLVRELKRGETDEPGAMETAG